MTETPQEVYVQHLSYSQLNTFASCPEQYRLERVIRVPRKPAWWFIGGTTVHELSEQYDLLSLGVDIPKLSFDEVFERLTAEAEEETGVERKDFRSGGRASQKYPNKENDDWWRQNGPAMVRRWETWRQGSNWEIWVGPDGQFGIELPFDLLLPDENVVVHGIIDRVFEDPSTSSLVVLDLKSGSRAPVTPRQLGTYKAGFEQSFPGAGLIRFGAFWDARKGYTGPVYPLNSYSLRRLNYQYGALRHARETGLYIPNPSMCSSCGVAEWCYEVGGERAHDVRPPWVSPEEWEAAA